MSTPISDRIERELGVVIDHGKADVERVWHGITGHLHRQPYDSSSSNPKENTMTTDTLRAELAVFLDKAEHDAAELEKFKNEPLAQGVLDMLQAVPEARDIITPVLAGLGKLAAMAPVTPAVTEPAPAETAAPADPQLQTGMAT